LAIDPRRVCPDEFRQNTVAPDSFVGHGRVGEFAGDEQVDRPHRKGRVLSAAPSTPTSAGGGYPSPARAWWLIAVLTAIYTFSLLDRQIIALLVKDIRSDLHITDFQMGLLQGIVFALFYVTFGLFFGWVADRFPRRSVALAGIVVWSLCTAACGLARNFTHLMAARFGVGAGEAALNPAAYSLISDTFPKRRMATAISVFGAGAHIGGGLSYMLGGFLIAALPAAGLALPLLGVMHPWRIVMLLAAIPAVLLAPLMWTMVNPPRRERLEGRTSVKDTIAFAVPRWRFLTGHFLGFGLMAAAANGYQAWAPSHLMRHFGLPIGEVGAILALIAIFAGIAGSLFSGWTVDRLFSRGRKDAHLLYFIVAAVTQLAGLCAGLTSNHLAVFFCCAALFQFSAGFAGVPAAALQLVTPNNYRGQISSAYLFFFNLIGTGLGPTMVGFYTTYVFHDDHKVGWAIALNAIIMLPLAIACFVFALAPMRKAVDASAAWSEAETPGAIPAAIEVT
jgi:MFS family permease